MTDVDQVAADLWSAVHGFVTLEVASHFAHFADPVESVLAPMAINHFVGMGDRCARAQRSARPPSHGRRTGGLMPRLAEPAR